MQETVATLPELREEMQHLQRAHDDAVELSRQLHAKVKLAYADAALYTC